MPLRIVQTVNEGRKRAMGRKAIKACEGNAKNRLIAMMGLTFKPSTDDMRETPSIAMVQVLKDSGAPVRAFDPKAMANTSNAIEGIEFAPDPYVCLGRTPWGGSPSGTCFALSIRRICMSPIVVGLRKVYRPEEMWQRTSPTSSSAADLRGEDRRR